MNQFDSPARIRNRMLPRGLTRIHFSALAVTTLIFTIIGLALVILSPLALRFFATATSGINWRQLSNVGQTYGAVSALLVVFGLTGVAVTVALQIRESRQNRIQAARDRHQDLMRMALEDSDLLKFWHGGLQNLTLEEDKISIYLNLIIQFWLVLWEFNDIDELELRNLCATAIFQSEIGLKFWNDFQRTGFETSARSRRGAKFYRIFNEEFEKAVESKKSSTFIKESGSRVQTDKHPPVAAMSLLLTSAAAGGAVGYAIIRKFLTSSK